MKLGQEYDIILLGKSYFSLLYGLLSVTKKGLRPLIVADKRFWAHGRWSEEMSSLEVAFLKALGSESGISHLLDIENFLTPSPSVFILDDVMIEMGPSPYGNLMELARKIPEIFSQDSLQALSQLNREQFDAQALELAQLRGEKLLKAAVNPHNKKPDSHFEQLFSEIGQAQVFFEDIFSLKGADKERLNHVFYVLGALFRPAVAYKRDHLEFSHLLLKALLPSFKVNIKEFEEELLFAYKTLGASYIDSGLRSLHFSRGRVEYIVLESFEGVVRSPQVYMFGHSVKSLDLQAPAPDSCFGMITIQSRPSSVLLNRFLGKSLFFSKHERAGAGYPWFDVFVASDESLRIRFAYHHGSGDRAKLHFDQACQDVYREISRWLFQDELAYTQWLSKSVLSDSNEICFEIVSGPKLPAYYHPEVFSRGRKIKNFVYMGPRRALKFGLLGYCVQLAADFRDA